MPQHVNCLVNDCHYWQSGNKCGADKIMIATDKFGASQPEQIDASMSASMVPEPAGSCMTTCCKSFIPKDSRHSAEDGIRKMK